jgi:hypothetical protein
LSLAAGPLQTRGKPKHHEEVGMRTLVMAMLAVSSLLTIFSSTSAAKGALLHALRSEQAEILAGEKGVFVIFAQTRDGSTVKKIEALDTLYLLADQGIPDMDRTLIFKTDKHLHLLRYRLVDLPWLDAVPFHPREALPDIDFRQIQRIVDRESGRKPIASIEIFFLLVENAAPPLIVNLQVKNDGDGSCDQYVYNVDERRIVNHVTGVACFFDLDQVFDTAQSVLTGP